MTPLRIEAVYEKTPSATFADGPPSVRFGFRASLGRAEEAQDEQDAERRRSGPRHPPNEAPPLAPLVSSAERPAPGRRFPASAKQAGGDPAAPALVAPGSSFPSLGYSRFAEVLPLPSSTLPTPGRGGRLDLRV